MRWDQHSMKVDLLALSVFPAVLFVQLSLRGACSVYCRIRMKFKSDLNYVTRPTVSHKAILQQMHIKRKTLQIKKVQNKRW